MLAQPRKMPYEGFIIDTNGTICKEINAGDKVRIIRASQIAHNQQYMNVNKQYIFTKLFCKASDILSTISFTSSETKFIFSMLSHMGFGEFSGYLIKIQCNMFAGFLNINEMGKIANIKGKTLERVIAGLQEKEIIQLEQVGRDKYIIVNPFIFMKKNEITRSQYEKFKNSKYNFWNK